METWKQYIESIQLSTARSKTRTQANHTRTPRGVRVQAAAGSRRLIQAKFLVFRAAPVIHVVPSTQQHPVVMLMCVCGVCVCCHSIYIGTHKYLYEVGSNRGLCSYLYERSNT